MPPAKKQKIAFSWQNKSLRINELRYCHREQALTARFADHYAVIVTSDVAPFRLRTLQETACVSLRRFDHPPGAVLTDSEEQAAESYQINVVERGWFRLGYGRRESVLGPGSIFVSRPGESYRYSHPRHLEPDTCLSLAFSSPVAGELETIFRDLPLVIPITNRLAFLRLHLSHTVEDDRSSLNALACDLVDAVNNAYRDNPHLYRPAQLKWYTLRISAAREMMAARPADRHSLWHLASHVGMSPFLFARVFRELVGIPPHKYLIHLRLQRARVLLELGMSVTDACYEVGFNNLSHFIRTFHGFFGVVPSRLKPSRAAKRHKHDLMEWTHPGCGE